MSANRSNYGRLVSFYLPLERPFALPAPQGFINPRNEEVPWLKDKRLPHPFNDPAFSTGKNFVAFQPIQGGGERKINMKPYAFSQMAAEMVSEGTEVGSKREWPEDISLGEGLMYTSLEMTTAILIDKHDSDEEALDKALDRCFDSLRSYELAYCLVSDDLAYPLTTRISAASFCPYAIFDVRESRYVERSTTMVNFTDPMRHGIPDFLSEEQIQETTERTNLARSGFPLTSSEYWFRESRRSQYILGKRDMAVVQAYTAGEVFLDSVLLMLAWEDLNYNSDSSLTKDKVASWYSFNNTHAWRVRKEFRTWLYGWDNGPSPRAHEEWLEVAASIRAKVVHAGYVPSIEESDSVLECYLRVVESVKILLADDRNRVVHPRTTLMTLNKAGLQRLGKYTNKMKRMFEDEGTGKFMDLFMQFQGEVLQLVESPPPRSE